MCRTAATKGIWKDMGSGINYKFTSLIDYNYLLRHKYC